MGIHNDEGPTGEVNVDLWLRDKIIHVLSLYPYLSQTMLQVGIGPSIPPKVWKPLLERLITEKVVSREQFQADTPEGQTRTYTRICLTKFLGRSPA